jgi:hypothetical protein
VSTGSLADTIRAYYRAYEAKDRNALEGLLTPDFRFSSPLDDRIDRGTYLVRCWPTAIGSGRSISSGSASRMMRRSSSTTCIRLPASTPFTTSSCCSARETGSARSWCSSADSAAR